MFNYKNEDEANDGFCLYGLRAFMLESFNGFKFKNRHLIKINCVFFVWIYERTFGAWNLCFLIIHVLALSAAFIIVSNLLQFIESITAEREWMRFVYNGCMEWVLTVVCSVHCTAIKMMKCRSVNGFFVCLFLKRKEKQKPGKPLCMFGFCFMENECLLAIGQWNMVLCACWKGWHYLCFFVWYNGDGEWNKWRL